MDHAGAFFSGFGVSLSLIVAIGAQNAYVLRQGLRREHVGLIVAICMLSDAALITLGIAGVSKVVAQSELFLLAVQLLGGVFLLGYGVLSVRRAIAGDSMEVRTDAPAKSVWAAAGTALALTFLNPHVYLDTVLLLGSIGASFGAARWLFAAGAVFASMIWFSALGFGARLLVPLFQRPLAWRILDSAIAVVMFAIAASLLTSFVVGLAA